MAILSETDRTKYFPLVKLTGDALLGAIEHAQAIAEREAMRPLELTEFVERITIPPSRKIPLKYQPVDFSKLFTVESQSHAGAQFTPLGDEHYVIEDGVLEVRNHTITRIQIRYWSGLQNDPAVKSAVAAILYFQILSP